MKIKIDSLKVKNFKGIKKFSGQFGGQSAVIKGANGLGKTSLIDAIHWLLTGVDSGYKSKFGILEIDKNGQTIDRQTAMVQAEMTIDRGQDNGPEMVELRREYQQKWTKKRGQATADLTGHTTVFHLNGVPVPKKKYDEYIAGIAPIERIKSLLDASYFCSKLKPDLRRRVLIGMIDTSSLKVVMPEILESMSIEDALLKLNAEKRAANKDLSTLPGRIDELKGMLPHEEIQEDDADKISVLSARIKDIEKKLIEISDSKVNSKTNQKYREVVASIKTSEQTIGDKYRAKIDRMKSDMENAEHDRQHAGRLISVCKDKLALTTIQLKANKEERDRLCKKWQEIKNRVFDPDTVCVTCNQELPKGNISEQHDRFKESNKRELSHIDEKGQALFKLHGQYEEEIKELNARSEEANEKYDKACSRQEGLETQLTGIHVNRGIEIKNTEKSLLEQKDKLEKTMEEESQKTLGIQSELEKELHELFYQRRQVTGKTPKTGQVEFIKTKLAKREEQFTLAAKTFEDIENKIMEIEAYSMGRSRLIEDKINEKFSTVKWRLFEHQINGGVKEICEAEVNGVLYNQDLNTGARINAGLDVIATLSDKYDLQLPVLIDNAESVTAWNHTGGQTLKMVADETADSLTIQI